MRALIALFLLVALAVPGPAAAREADHPIGPQAKAPPALERASKPPRLFNGGRACLVIARCAGQTCVRPAGRTLSQPSVLRRRRAAPGPSPRRHCDTRRRPPARVVPTPAIAG